jgi:uncharacterized membrane protein (DUF106 family)
MIRRFLLWFTQVKLGLVRNEIRSTTHEIQEAAFDEDERKIEALEQYAYDLVKEQRNLLEQIRNLRG